MFVRNIARAKGLKQKRIDIIKRKMTRIRRAMAKGKLTDKTVEYERRSRRRSPLPTSQLPVPEGRDVMYFQHGNEMPEGCDPNKPLEERDELQLARRTDEPLKILKPFMSKKKGIRPKYLQQVWDDDLVDEYGTTFTVERGFILYKNKGKKTTPKQKYAY